MALPSITANDDTDITAEQKIINGDINFTAGAKKGVLSGAISPANTLIISLAVLAIIVVGASTFLVTKKRKYPINGGKKAITMPKSPAKANKTEKGA